MSGGVRQRPIADESSELVVRPVLGPAGNKTTTTRSSSLLLPHQNKQQPLSKPRSTTNHHPKTPPAAPPLQCTSVADLHSNLSLNASCSSDVSSDSPASTTTGTGRTRTRRRTTTTTKTKQKTNSVSDCDSVASSFDTSSQKRCAWVTPNTEPCYAAFHDEEWGVPVHDDKKLFELLVFSGALAELTWPTILMKRHIFREVFAEFDPASVSKLNEKKITAPGSTASSLLSELKLRAIIENARQITKIIGEFGSFDKYIWSFVNYKPIVNRFRYPRQVPAKTSKADVISKDLLKRGFRSVSVTVIYSFMQVAGITNDHLMTCFRYQECTNPTKQSEEDSDKVKSEEKSKDGLDVGLARAMNEFSFPSE